MDKTTVLLVLPRDVLDQARVLAGKAITKLKLPVSLQIVLRALIEEGLTRDTDPVLLANVEAQARAIRDRRMRVAATGEGAASGRTDGGRILAHAAVSARPRRRK